VTDERRGSATTVASWILVATFVVIALAAPLISPYRPTAPAGAPLEPPSAGHVLGTNAIGQDVASQMVSGTRVSLVIAALAGFGTLAIGAVIGLAAALGGPVVDRVLMRIVDLMLTIPRLPLLIVVSLYVGPTLLTMALVISFTGWPSTARVVRSQTLSLRSRAHLAAVRGFGGSTLYATRRHVVPELGLILVAGFIGAAGRSVVLEAGLAFLGLGDPTRMSWGRILRDAVDFGGLFFTDAWAWWLLPPVLAISLLLLSLSFLGVAAERRLAPRLRRHEDLRV
jgi:peptide/nickel transport system permease protein